MENKGQELKRKNGRRGWRIVWRLLLLAVILSVLSLIICDHMVKQSSKGRVYTDLEEVPYRKVGLLLGTSPYTDRGTPNLYYARRIEAAARLYAAGKVSYLLVSGDNHRKGYNEPEEMRKSLVAAGVPDSAIYLDYAGFRTFDSMVRAKKVFGQDSLIVISQNWHNERAIYLAKTQDVDAIAYCAEDVMYRHVYLKNHLREKLARVKAVTDVVFGKQPKFLGEPVEIP